MSDEILQFGGMPPAGCREKIGAYAIVYNDEGKILVCKVNAGYHLLGGGVDKGEDHIVALKREAMEEAGAEIANIELIGKANQYFEEYNLNKLGTLYKAKLVSFKPELSKEEDHHPIWMTPDEFINDNTGEFQKWAVRQAEKV